MKRNDYEESDIIGRFKNKRPSEIKLWVRSEGIKLIEYESIKGMSKKIGFLRKPFFTLTTIGDNWSLGEKADSRFSTLNGFDSCVKHHSKCFEVPNWMDLKADSRFSISIGFDFCVKHHSKWFDVLKYLMIMSTLIKVILLYQGVLESNSNPDGQIRTWFLPQFVDGYLPS